MGLSCKGAFKSRPCKTFALACTARPRFAAGGCSAARRCSANRRIVGSNAVFVRPHHAHLAHWLHRLHWPHTASRPEAAGHTVHGGASPRSAGAQPGRVPMDFARDTTAAAWLPGCSGHRRRGQRRGVLRDTRARPIDAVHRDTPIALFDACAQAGVRRVVQISALGIDGSEHALRANKNGPPRRICRHWQRRAPAPRHPAAQRGVRQRWRQQRPVHEPGAPAGGAVPRPRCSTRGCSRSRYTTWRQPWWPLGPAPNRPASSNAPGPRRSPWAP